MKNSQAQILLALNSIVAGLRFTIEDFEDFEDGRLPTLDFALEISEEGDLGYTFFEKTMNSRWVTPANAAASEENKITWLSNDLVRRLLRISEEKLKMEAEKTINSYDEKLIFSGYKIKQRTQVIERGICDFGDRVGKTKGCWRRTTQVSGGDPS